MQLGVILPQQVMFAIVLIFVAYFCERKYKYEFLQIKNNRKLKNEFKHILEVVPEAIMIYDPKTLEVVMTNTEFQRLLSKYAKI